MYIWPSRLTERLRAVLGIGLSTGAKGERAATRFLKRQGYKILARNLRNRYGEIDILAQAPDGHTVVVVEVKSSDAVSAPGDKNEIRPEVHVSVAKQRKLSALATQMAKRYRLDNCPIRFDVIGVSYYGKESVIRHHPGAFDASF